MPDTFIDLSDDSGGLQAISIPVSAVVAATACASPTRSSVGPRLARLARELLGITGYRPVLVWRNPAVWPGSRR